MNKLKLYNGQPVKKCISLKLDGIQCMLKDGQVVSRAEKPLYNIDPTLLEDGKRYECYLGSFKETESVLRTHNHQRKVQKHELYEIWPETDGRLQLPLADVQSLFNLALQHGYEGLVIDQKYKLKPKETHDVVILKVIPGKGKYEGKMGALLTERGKVGSGFTDEQRALEWRVGDMIEVDCMELTEAGNFRHPRFIRLRWDKK